MTQICERARGLEEEEEEALRIYGKPSVHP
jgi:hypothetical protein